MSSTADYVPPKVWSWVKQNGGRFANINRPVAGATHEKELPVGRHPLQLYSLGTPNGVKVTIIEFLDRALPNEDVEVSKEIQRQYKKYGIEILTSTKVESVTDHGDRVTVAYTGNNDGAQGSIDADKVLMSIGFVGDCTCSTPLSGGARSTASWH